jgi:hypothetical protein
VKGFNAWAERHCTVFGLLDARQMEMVASWQEFFDHCGYTADELNAATTWLACNDPPRFPSDHLPALQRRLRLDRENATIRAAIAADRQRACREREEAESKGGLKGFAEALRAGGAS